LAFTNRTFDDLSHANAQVVDIQEARPHRVSIVGAEPDSRRPLLVRADTEAVLARAVDAAKRFATAVVA